MAGEQSLKNKKGANNEQVIDRVTHRIRMLADDG